MGRGRQKAKHTKIARELKSYSPDVDYAALERELGHGQAEEDDPYAAWADYVPEGGFEDDDDSGVEDDDERLPKSA